MSAQHRSQSTALGQSNGPVVVASVDWAVCLPFYLGGVLWTVIYDSIYAFQDREFDKKLGLRSTAIEMENRPKETLTALAAMSTGLFALGGV